MTTAEQVHPLDPKLSRRDLGIVDDLVAHALEQVRAGRTLTWDEAVAYVRAHPAVSVSGDNAPTIAVVAVNRLEETGEVVYDRDNDLRLRRDDDPTFAADPSTIERAVVDHMSTGHNSSVWKLYAEVFRGRYVHRDVYYACRALLADGLLAKPNAQGPLLRYVAPVTTTRVKVPAESGAVTFEQQLAADIAQLDAELETVEERRDDDTDETIETVLRRKARQLEGQLRDRYASHRGIPRDDVEYAVLSGQIDVLDRARRRVVEAKLDAGLTSVCQAVGQAEGYLFALQRFEGVAVDRVAVLLPKRPGPFVLEYLGAIVTAGRPVGLVYLDGDRFVEHTFASSTPTAAVRA